MVNFKYSLLAAALVAGLAATDANADKLTDCANAKPKFFTSLTKEQVSLKGAKAPAHVKKVKKTKSKSPRHAAAKFAKAAAAQEVIYDCSFSFLSEGSVSAPAALELDDWDNIPEELIGEANYGFGGQGLMQAGGAVYVPFECEDPDDPDWPMEGLLWTPDVYEPMTITVTLDAKIANGDDYPSDDLYIYATDYVNLLDYDAQEIGTAWTHVTFTLDITEFLPESEDDSYYFSIFCDEGADVVIKNLVISGEAAPLVIPHATEYTDYTGTSFTAHWGAVENATGYLLTVYDYDAEYNDVSTVFLDKQPVDGTSFTVTGITPGAFYAYNVCATDGSYTTSPSNTVLVCEIAAPSGVKIAASDDLSSLIFSWQASPGANFYVVEAGSVHDVTAGQTVSLVDVDFSEMQSDGTVSEPEMSGNFYDTFAEMPGWEFTLGCSAEGAFGFMDDFLYAYFYGMEASLASGDYDLSNLKDGEVNVSIEAASPGNGMLVGLFSLNEATGQYEAGSTYGTPGDVPEDYATYDFTLSGGSQKSRFLFITNTDEDTDGAILIRSLKITGEATDDGTVDMPFAEIQTEDTSETLDCAVEKGVTYTAVVTPYLLDYDGYVIAVGKPSEVVSYKLGGDQSAVSAIEADSTARYYNLQGLPVDTPAKGSILIKVTKNGTSKIRL